jgi:hypothetical protein
VLLLRRALTLTLGPDLGNTSVGKWLMLLKMPYRFSVPWESGFFIYTLVNK